MVLNKRRAVVAALFIFLVLSPEVLLIAHASRDSGRKKTSGIMEASDPRTGEKLMSAELQFQNATGSMGYNTGQVELRWDEERKVISLVDGTANLLWQSSVEEDSPPSITMSLDSGGIFIVSMMDHAKKQHWKLRACRTGSEAKPMKIAVANTEIHGNVEPAGEKEWAGRLTSVLQNEVSLKFGLFTCLVAGTCVQSCMAPQCGGAPEHCECTPRGFCHLDLEGKRCIPVIAKDSYSAEKKFGPALSVADKKVVIQGQEQYMVRNESDILTAFQDVMENVRRNVDEASDKTLGQLADALMYANILHSMAQDRELFRRRLPWTANEMHKSATMIESWVQKLDQLTKQKEVAEVEGQCGVELKQDSTYAELFDVVENHCMNDPNAFSVLQRARSGASIDRDGSSLLPVLALVLVAAGTTSTVAGLIANRNGPTQMGTFFFVIGGVCFIASGHVILKPLMHLTATHGQAGLSLAQKNAYALASMLKILGVVDIAGPGIVWPIIQAFETW